MHGSSPSHRFTTVIVIQNPVIDQQETIYRYLRIVSMFFFPSFFWYYPIGSMYAIYGNIYHQYTPNVSIYIPYMDPMGIRICHVMLA